MAEPVQVRCFTLCSRERRSMRLHDGCKVYVDSYMVSNGSCFMVTWIIILKNDLLEDDLTQNQEDHGTLNAHIHWFILIYRVWGPAWIDVHWSSIWWRTRSCIWLHITLEGPWPHYMILEVSWDGLWTLSFGLSQFHGHERSLQFVTSKTIRIGDNECHIEHSFLTD